jgi:hypothetical protein
MFVMLFKHYPFLNTLSKLRRGFGLDLEKIQVGSATALLGDFTIIMFCFMNTIFMQY